MKLQRRFAPAGGQFTPESVASFIGIYSCIFLSKVATYSCLNWPPIPIESGHPFLFKLATFLRISEFKITKATLDNFKAIRHHCSPEKKGGQDGTKEVIHA